MFTIIHFSYIVVILFSIKIHKKIKIHKYLKFTVSLIVFNVNTVTLGTMQNQKFPYENIQELAFFLLFDFLKQKSLSLKYPK